MAFFKRIIVYVKGFKEPAFWCKKVEIWTSLGLFKQYIKLSEEQSKASSESDAC
jgi:hypothetical protein